MRILSVCLSVKRVICDKMEVKSVQTRFLYHTEDHLAYFSEKNGWWGRPLLPEILGQPATVGANSPIFNRYSLVSVAPQP